MARDRLSPSELERPWPKREAEFIATRQGLGIDYARKQRAHEPFGGAHGIDRMAQCAAPPVRHGPSRIQ